MAMSCASDCRVGEICCQWCPFSVKWCHDRDLMSLPAMSLGLRFCVSRMGGTGGGGWVHSKGANSMAMSELHKWT